MSIDLTALQNLIRTAAREELLPRFAKIGHSYKADGSVLTEADLAMDRRLRQELATHWPDIRFLSEEMEPQEQARLIQDSERPLWCLDPLDGTSNFAAGIPFFGVSLALIEQARVTAGVIYDPCRDENFVAGRDQGALLNQQPLHGSVSTVELHQAIALVDFKRLAPGLRQRLSQEPPFKSQRNFGSCALEWAWMAAGRGHVYLHGGQKLWDLAAGSLILEEAGGVCRTLDGETVFNATMAPRSVVSSPDRALFDHWNDWLQNAVSA